MTSDLRLAYQRRRRLALAAGTWVPTGHGGRKRLPDNTVTGEASAAIEARYAAAIAQIRSTRRRGAVVDAWMQPR